MKVCPKCGKVAAFNSYFNAYICNYCGWEERKKRNVKALYIVTATRGKKRTAVEALKKEGDEIERDQP